MMTILALLGGLYAVGTVVFFVGMRNAPEGFEDENGFQVIWCNNAPEVKDVACVWSFGDALPA